MAILFLNICLYIECLMEIYETMFNEIDDMISADSFQEFEIKEKLKTIVKFHINITE